MALHIKFIIEKYMNMKRTFFESPNRKEKLFLWSLNVELHIWKVEILYLKSLFNYLIEEVGSFV